MNYLHYFASYSNQINELLEYFKKKILFIELFQTNLYESTESSLETIHSQLNGLDIDQKSLNEQLSNVDSFIKELNSRLSNAESYINVDKKSDMIYVTPTRYNFYNKTYFMGEQGFLSIGPGYHYFQGNFTILNNLVDSTLTQLPISFNFKIEFTSDIDFIHLTTYKLQHLVTNTQYPIEKPLLGGYISSKNENNLNNPIFEMDISQTNQRYICHYEGTFKNSNFCNFYPSLTYTCPGDYEIMVEQGSFFLTRQYNFNTL